MSTPLADALRRRIRHARRRLTAAAVAQGALITGGVVAAVALVAVAAEAGFWLGVELRTAVFWLLAALLAGLTAALVVVPLLRGAGVLPGLDERAVVRRAGRDYAGVDDRLATFLDLADGHASGGAGRLHEAALDALGREVRDVPFERVHAFGPAWRTARWAAVPALLLAALFLGAPSTVGGAAARLLAPGVYFAPPAPFRLDVSPGDAAVSRGASLPVAVQAAGRELPLTARLEIGRADERATETVRLQADDLGAFAYTVEDVRADMRYRVLADGVRSRWYAITVENRPLVRGVQVTVAPPAYSGRRARRLPEGVGDVTGLVGSGVRVRVQLGGTRPEAAWLQVAWEDGRTQRVPLRVEGDQASGGFGLRGGGTYSVRLEAQNGLQNADAATYSLGTLSDGPPQIALLEGAEDPLSGDARHLVFRVTDDFGFSGGALVYRVAVSEGGAAGPLRRLRLPVRSRPLDQEVGLDLRLPGIRPGATVELYGTVRDNDGRGGKTARTPSFTLRYPTLADRLDAFDADRDSAAQALDELQETAEESGERFRRLRDDLRQSLDPDWEDRRQVEELLREQSELGEQAQDLREQMRRLSEQMQRQDLTDEATRQRFEQMQRVMDELDTPELRDALERLRDAMERLDLQDMLQESEEAAQTEEEFRRRLERAMSLMKRLEAAVEMEEAARRAEDLAETEERLARETEAMRPDRPAPGENEPERGGEPTPPRPNTPAERERLAEEQRRAAEDAEALEEQLENAREAADDVPRAPTEALEQMMEQMQQDGGLPQQMEQNAQQLQQNQLQDAQEGQEEMSKQLRQMAQKMRQQSAQMQGQQAQVDQAALRRSLEDVLTLSREQERLAGETQAIPARNPALVPVARRQGELRDGLAAVTDTLRRVALSVPQLGPDIDERAGNARREMAGALEQLAERQSRQGAAHQRTAMSHLNELALLLSNLLDQLQNQSQQQGGEGQGMPQKMQQIGQQQQRLNQRIQQMLNESAGERLSPGEGRRMRQMAEQQEALRRQLQRAVEGGGAGLEPGDRSALKRVEDQMREAAQDLRRGRADRRTAPRQQQILEKLLEAEESVNQRGREEQREAQTGTARPDPDRPAPPRTERPAERVRRDLIRALESGYASDYQDLIKRYFERLQQRTGG
ncbi:DUF4175 family protein [Rubrivirga litoralis]|uniref:DUF4175 family protein n=1 Tax=Rubrivirga litoralis TaxID=3075598 RepID=A0ABU3BPH5_9BACT|nr:DUF4175 family protein [Rubrivirga sp. F394]MDT0631180.1 DUF4175 family protein [Rubrivirga sp. F394]